MARSLRRSSLHLERALARLPLGVASDCRNWGQDRTFYVKRASGARLWDIDDNEYIDYRLGRGQVILGYADPRVAKAARAGIEVGGVFALATELEFAVAERIAKLVPAAELVRFSNSGAEAVVDALRLARAFTGKAAVAVVEGGSHGLLGATLWDATHQDRPQDTSPSPRGSAVRGPFDSLIYRVPANDANGFEELLSRHADRIGALLIEPIPVDCASTAADAAYLGDIRALCDRFEVALVIDEVTTGFRVARGGVQEVLGVRADLCTFGPSMASGFPIAALAGREEIMRRIGNEVAQGSTHAAHPVSLAAADKTLEILDETDALERVETYGWRMREGMNQALSRRDIPHTFAGPPSMSCLCLGESAPSGDPEREKFDHVFRVDLATRLHGVGILCEANMGGSWFVSAAHDAADAALERLSDARRRTASGARRSPGSFANPG